MGMNKTSGEALFAVGGTILGGALNTYSTVKAAKSNENLANAQAEYIEQVTARNLELTRRKALMDMRLLASNQEQEYAQNRVNAAASGNVGASATAFFSGSILGYGQQRNQLALQKNMEMLNLMVDGSLQAGSLRAAAEAYREKANSALFTGIVNTTAGLADTWYGKNVLTDDSNLLSGGVKGNSVLAAALLGGGLASTSAQSLKNSQNPWYKKPVLG